MELIFRRAVSEDASSIAALHAENWRQSYRGLFADSYLDQDVWADREACWQQRLQCPAADQLVLLALDDDRLCGFVCAYGTQRSEGTFIDNLHVAAGYQGQGIGRALMQQVYDWATLNYADQGIYLEVLADNHPARRFYERLGAEHMKTSRWLPPGSTTEIDDLFYGWRDLKSFTGF